MWAAKQENFQPAEKCFFLTSPFIELTGQVILNRFHLSGYGSVNQASRLSVPKTQSLQQTLVISV
jgi:hypothetical protein